MKWRQGRRSRNIEDRRGRRAAKGFKLGGGATILVVVVSLFLGQNPLQMLDLLGGGSLPGMGTSQSDYQPTKADQENAEFVSVVMASTEDAWQSIFKRAGGQYQEPKLVLFNGMVQSACGSASAASGPFYCPGDDKVYIDLSFFEELRALGAPGDFARAYVLGHEVGHHVQNLLGTTTKVRKLQQRSNQKNSNALSVMMELQADCYAGVWAHTAHRQTNILEAGDVEEGLVAAASIGDDRLMRNAGRVAHPDSFTHGSSKQRVQWFRIGLESGKVALCDTFQRMAKLKL